jgi:hypothetical protein
MRNMMVKMSIVSLLAICSMCTTKHSSPTSVPDETPDNVFGLLPNQFKSEIADYSIRNSSIYIITSLCKCDSLGDKESTTSLREIPFSISNDSLKIFLSKDTIGTSKIDVSFYKKYIRIPACTTNCSSIYGKWKLESDGYVAGMELTPADSQIAENLLVQLREGYDYLNIDTYNIIIYHLLDTIRSFAWHFLMDWNKYYSTHTSVIVDTSSNGESVLLTGRVDHDSVWITRDTSGYITTRSSDTHLQTHVYNPFGTECSKHRFPTWYEEVFLRNNSSDIPYISIDAPKPGDTLHVGDTIQASIAFNSAFVKNNTGMTISVSVNNGLNWYPLVCTESGFPQIRLDKSYSHQPHIVIPEVLKTDNPSEPTANPVSNEALFEVVSYTNHSARSQTSCCIVILPKSGSVQ